MPSTYYCKVNGQLIGPISPKHLRYLAFYGRLAPEDLVRKEGTEEWVKAGSLANLFEATDRAAPAAPAPPAHAVRATPPPAAPKPQKGPAEPASPVPESAPALATPSPAWKAWKSPVAGRRKSSGQEGNHLRYAVYIGVGSAGVLVVLLLVGLLLALLTPRL